MVIYKVLRFLRHATIATVAVGSLIFLTLIHFQDSLLMSVSFAAVHAVIMLIVFYAANAKLGLVVMKGFWEIHSRRPLILFLLALNAVKPLEGLD